MQPVTTSSPHVGIFWFYGGKIIFRHSVPLAEGVAYGDAVTGTKDHADYWEALRAEGLLAALPEDKREEYFSVPRGRVVWHGDSGKFSVYHGGNIPTAGLRKVAREFCLPQDKTVFEQDLHYRDLSDAEWQGLWGM